jgi:hypothetical protein
VDRVIARGRLSADLELAAATIRAEIADHDGQYKRAASLLEDFVWVTGDLESDLHRSKAAFQFPEKGAAWRRLRQRLFYQWQRSVSAYRAGEFPASRSLMRIARTIAEKLEPRPEGLLTQLYYGAGKLAFQQGKFSEATRLYRDSIVNAAAGPATARAEAATAEELQNEEAAARYSIAKALALGMGQCLREQGRLEEAYPVVVAGRLLLDASGDRALIFHAQQTLASIERGTAGEREQRLLKSARKRLEECIEYFSDPQRDEWFRSRYELALVYMQQGLLPRARRLMQMVRAHAEGPDRKPKWIANASIGLSRIERRDNDFDLAIRAARHALSAVGAEQKKIARRASGSLARALAAAAIARPTPETLDDAKNAIDGCLQELEKDDIRNRLTLDLWNALVLNAMSKQADADAALREYEEHATRVDIGRIKEFAEQVRAVVRRPAGGLGLPIERGEFGLQANLDALDVRFAINIAGLQPATEISSSLYFHRNTTGDSLSSCSASSIRRFSSSFDSTRIPRRMLRASFEKKVSIRFSHDPCVGVKMSSKRLGRVPRNALVSFDTWAE